LAAVKWQKIKGKTIEEDFRRTGVSVFEKKQQEDE